MPDFDLTLAGAHERPVLDNLFQLYTHDFSEQWAGLPRGELDEAGLFPPYPLAPYWRDPDHIPLLLRIGGRIAGFALVNKASHTGRPVDRNVAEFFVVRKHRRDGLGTRMAHEVFNRYPGQWEAAVTRRNVAAQRFWRRTVETHPGVSEIEETDVADAGWSGPVIRFRIGA